MSLRDLEERVDELEQRCARYEERIGELKADNKEVKDILNEQNRGQEEFKQSMFDRMDKQRTLIITTLAGVLTTILGSVVLVTISHLW